MLYVLLNFLNHFTFRAVLSSQEHYFFFLTWGLYIYSWATELQIKMNCLKKLHLNIKYEPSWKQWFVLYYNDLMLIKMKDSYIFPGTH